MDPTLTRALLWGFAAYTAYGVGLVADLMDVEVGEIAPDGAVQLTALRPLHEEIPHPLPDGLYAAIARFDGHPLAVVGCSAEHSA